MNNLPPIQSIWAIEVMFHVNDDDEYIPSEIYECFSDESSSKLKMIAEALNSYSEDVKDVTFILKTKDRMNYPLTKQSLFEAYLKK